jgi:hypothetical protein
VFISDTEFELGAVKLITFIGLFTFGLFIFGLFILGAFILGAFILGAFIPIEDVYFIQSSQERASMYFDQQIHPLSSQNTDHHQRESSLPLS